MTQIKGRVYPLVFAALCLTLAFVLPYLTGQIPEIGQVLSPMHIPVFLCALSVGPWYGLAVGAIAPLLRSLLVGMPPLYPMASAMAFEMAAYGLVAGLALRWLKQGNRTLRVYAALLIAMVIGRFVYGAAMYLMLMAKGQPYTFAAFFTGTFVKALPGIFLHLAVVPPIVVLLDDKKLTRT